ncbi:MAG TPA: N-acetyltransferase family protein [Bacteroidia bacterium]|nr:N-acetyltransferase family protein [Bacteroidia bacterium]
MIRIHAATENDQPDILAIYNEAVLNTTATFDVEPRTAEAQMEWFRRHKQNHPVLVAVADDRIVGWASLSPWSDRCAYDTTVEVSVYIDKDFRGKGIGSRLLESITLEGQRVKNHTVISRISSDNQASIRIHEKAGYKTIGVMKEVGFKFGKFLDVTMMQYIYPFPENLFYP